MRFAVRITRTAISPRFAMRSLENIETAYSCAWSAGKRRALHFLRRSVCAKSARPFGADLMRMTTLAMLASALPTGSALADANSAYLTANAKKPGVHVTASVLQYKPLGRKGNTAQKPGGSDCVTGNYKATFIDGRVFDPSPPGKP